ncbi:hypothetical protein C1H46_003625 [Malus baccata]|uniref:Uncharacterized protein n=1 Tax=Malus baccata TaxID=106549 RepID=A0A540NI46_MALBA|nr:hypothetical protein C1H46_003625 [Malus baccata]
MILYKFVRRKKLQRKSKIKHGVRNGTKLESNAKILVGLSEINPLILLYAQAAVDLKNYQAYVACMPSNL